MKVSLAFLSVFMIVVFCPQFEPLLFFKEDKCKINANNILFLALSLTFTVLLGETHVGLTTLCGIHFQCVVPT